MMLDAYQDWLAERYDHYPRNHFATVILVRAVQSETIFRTEGSGEDMSTEFVHAGLQDSTPIERVIMSKRKAIAVERRQGRAAARRVGMLPEECILNANQPCGYCVDCMVYGYAVGGDGTGAQKSRVVADNGFALLPASENTGYRQANAIYETGTMRNPAGEQATSIFTDHYLKPGAHIVDMETMYDVTADELVYVLGNILAARRYGAVSSRMGKISNHIVALIFSNAEMFSTLELTQATYDGLQTRNFPLHTGYVSEAMLGAVEDLLPSVTADYELVTGEALLSLLDEVKRIYASDEALRTLLERIQAGYPVSGEAG